MDLVGSTKLRRSTMVTPEELCEIEEIKEVRYLYTHYYDGQRVEELADLFTEDAVC
ncbi:MAG: hypothetical protein F4152_04105, partial [Dehalococcoidia bacterium]|nr:hypothetical protein [Dehalococcoidia bacterium]